MRIQDILERKGAKVITIAPSCSVQDAVRKLCEYHIGALVVVNEGGAPIGIVTERDIMMDCGYKCSQLEALADPEKESCPRFVKDIMTHEIVTGSLDDVLEDVMELMTLERVRHLPVIDHGTLAGLVSIGDVVHAHLVRTAAENASLKCYISGTPS